MLGPGVRRRQLDGAQALQEMPSNRTENLSQGQRDPTLQLRHGPIIPQATPPGAAHPVWFLLSHQQVMWGLMVVAVQLDMRSVRSWLALNPFR